MISRRNVKKIKGNGKIWFSVAFFVVTVLL